MQLEFFKIEKNKEKNFSSLIVQKKSKNKLTELLSDNFIKEKGMYILRSELNKAKSNQEWNRYLKILKLEISFKKGEITLNNAVKSVILSTIK